MILSDLNPDILGRIEENVESGPVFWSQTGEVYVQAVDGMFEASLLTGVVQVGAVSVTLQANTNYFGLQTSSSGYGAIVGPGKGILAPIRLRQAWPIRKTTLKELDNMYPAWEQATPTTQLIAWFPLGISGFGIYPALVAESVVTMDYLFCPINEYRPYNGSETIPFQPEFADGFSQFAAAMLRIKEGGAEAEEATQVYQQYLSRMKALSLFQDRLDMLNFSTAFGGHGQVNARSAV